jgi:hypothetical protein
MTNKFLLNSYIYVNYICYNEAIGDIGLNVNFIKAE